MKILSPAEITSATLEIGCAKASAPAWRLWVQSVMAGCFIAFGGILSVIVGFGFPEITASNPGLQRLLSGVMFPIGLILVVVLGAELFTGNNALLIPGCLQGRFGWRAIWRNWVIVYLGNFIGALLFAYFLVYLSGLTAQEPYSGAICRMAQAKVSMTFWQVLLKGIGANWCVCLAVWLALAGHTLIEKMAGCFLPVMAFVALGYEHCIANMFFIPAGMMQGADVGLNQFLIDNLLPATIGNIIGGAVFVGCVQAYIHTRPRKNHKS